MRRAVARDALGAEVGGCDGGAVCFLGAVSLGGGEDDPKADGDGVVDSVHHLVVEVSHPLAQAAFIEGADLLKQNDRIAGESGALGVDIDMGGEARLAHPRGDRGGDDGGAVFIADVVLNYKHGAQAALLGADDGGEIGVEYVSASDGRVYVRWAHYVLHPSFGIDRLSLLLFLP